MAINTTNTRFGYGSVDTGRQSALLQSARLQEESATAQLRAGLNGQTLPQGSTVTARTRYTVGRDGALIPTETKITTQTPGDSIAQDAGDRRRGRKYFELQEQSGGSALASLLQPRPVLSPADEVALYASLSNTTENANLLNADAIITPGKAIAEDGSTVEVEIIKPLADMDARTAQILALNSRAQAQAASLYARNNDIVFSVTPYSELAA